MMLQAAIPIKTLRRHPNLSDGGGMPTKTIMKNHEPAQAEHDVHSFECFEKRQHEWDRRQGQDQDDTNIKNTESMMTEIF